MQFGGHPEDETEPWRVALREAREESGLAHLVFVQQQAQPACFDVDVHEIPARGDRPAHLHLDLRYLLATDAPESAGVTDESNDVRWFALPELASLDLDPGVRRMIHKAAKTLGWA
jgi:8-oxo-dGTP pyrophosphatase MutT (NUDIX family)